jgi:hypothetical protein
MVEWSSGDLLKILIPLLVNYFLLYLTIIVESITPQYAKNKKPASFLKLVFIPA